MPNYVYNKLRIHCDDNETMETIGELLFKRNEEGKLYYTMTKLLPVPEGFEINPAYTKYGRNWCISNWGTKWDICSPKIAIGVDEIIIRYETAWDPNDEWLRSLCMLINTMTCLCREENMPQIIIEHDFCEMGLDMAGHLYWEPRMEFKYESYSYEEYAKRLENKLKKENLIRINEEKVLEFNIDDSVIEEPEENKIILPDELIEEMKLEMLQIRIEPNDFETAFYVKHGIYIIEEMSRIFNPIEIFALFENGAEFYLTKNMKNIKSNVVRNIVESKSTEYSSIDKEDLITRIHQIPEFLFHSYIKAIVESSAAFECLCQYQSYIQGHDMDDIVNCRYTEKPDLMKQCVDEISHNDCQE